MEQRRLLCATLTLVVVGLLGCVGGNHAARSVLTQGGPTAMVDDALERGLLIQVGDVLGDEDDVSYVEAGDGAVYRLTIDYQEGVIHTIERRADEHPLPAGQQPVWRSVSSIDAIGP